MNILVTGGAGFIGSHIANLLVEAGHSVTVLDSLAHGRADRLSPGIRFLRADITDPALAGLIAPIGPEVVIHEAAHVSVPGSIKDPLADARINILGTINLLEACVASGVRKVIYPSSAALFARVAYLPIDENHPVSFGSPYGISKYTAEHYLAVYRALYGLEYTILRYANVYGPGQDSGGEGGVVAVFAQAMRSGITPTINGDGTATRDFIYVGDVARANLAALTGLDGATVNVSTGIPTTIRALYDELARLLGFDEPPIFGPPRPGDILHSYLSTALADALVPFPRTPLVQGLSRMVGITP